MDIFLVRVCVYVYLSENACGDSEMRVSGDISYGYSLPCLCAGCTHAMLYLLNTCEIHFRCMDSGANSRYVVEKIRFINIPVRIRIYTSTNVVFAFTPLA